MTSPNPAIAAGFGAYQEESRYRWEAEIGIKKTQLDQTYKVAMMNARTAQEQNSIDREYKRAQIDLAKQAQALDEKEEAFNEWEKTNRLGFDMAKTGADLAAVTTNPFALADFSRGLGYVPGAMQALQALQGNGMMAPLGGPAGGQPNTYTLGSLTQQIMNGASNGGAAPTAAQGTARPGGDPQQGTVLPPGVQSTGNPQADANLAAANAIALRGMARLRPGSLEQLDPLEMGILQSGWQRSGWDGKSLLSQYDATRPGQSSAALG